MSWEGSTPENLTGSMLVAHPRLLDPNFRRTILFLSHHSAEDGAIGLILNRPLRKTFGEVAVQNVSDNFKNVTLYYGGPVAADHLTLASLQWRTDPASVAFQSFMGNIEDVHIEPQWRLGLRAFVGYAGWSRGQLEGEISQKAWLVVPPARELIEMKDPENTWRRIMRSSGPLMKLLAEAPDDPEMN
ncbi:MAG TPA: YqgE/AlgH family protein [Terrimicrobiaceae bacterium]